MTQTEYRISPWNPTDRADLMQFFMKLWNGKRGQAEYLLQSATARNASVLVVKKDNEIVGYAETVRVSQRKVHFNRSAVLKDHRQQGLFNTMLQEVVRKAGKKEITAEVSVDAHHLPPMRRVGFEVEEVEGSRAKIIRPKISLFG